MALSIPPLDQLLLKEKTKINGELVKVSIVEKWSMISAADL
jgi:hypothetical protein